MGRPLVVVGRPVVAVVGRPVVVVVGRLVVDRLVVVGRPVVVVGRPVVAVDHPLVAVGHPLVVVGHPVVEAALACPLGPLMVRRRCSSSVPRRSSCTLVWYALLGVLDFRRRPWVLQVGDPVCPRFVYVLFCQQCHAVPIEAVLLSVRVTKVDTPGGPKRYRIDAEDREKADAAFKELRPSLAPAKKAAPVGGAGAASAAALAGTKGVAAVQELEPARTPAPRRPGARQATQYARS